jgi:glycosyl hydrolase family 59 (putative galactocerebrosidase)
VRELSATILSLLPLVSCGSEGSNEGAGNCTMPGPREPQPTADFESDEPGKPPAGWVPGLTGEGKPSQWLVRSDPDAPAGPHVLAQVNDDDTDNRFPLCIYQAPNTQDVRVSTAFKAVSGNVDQAAGLVARFRDAKNYYVTRANALENNVRLYRVVDGHRQQFAGVECEVSGGKWHRLALDVKGQHFRVSFDGKLLFEADDATFTGPGLVGLWTKADSFTFFDEFRVEQQ